MGAWQWVSFTTPHHCTPNINISTGLDQEDHDDWAESAMVGAHLLLQWEGVDEEGKNGGISLGIDNMPFLFARSGVWLGSGIFL